MTAQPDIREFEVTARNTDVFGRVLCAARDHHFVVDGPVQNGCPGEAVTPAEIFLSGVAACGVELLQVLAQRTGVRLESVGVAVRATMDRNKPVHPRYSIFHTVGVHFTLEGVTASEAEALVESFAGT
ncbi:MAG: OsmC family protein [Thermoleophilia bacterium]|nr:OsmC family protein [Thermoleophilia bacterium]